MPTKIYNDLKHMIDASAVAVLCGLARVLFISVCDYKERIATFVACVAVGLVAGVIIAPIASLQDYSNAIIAISSLGARELVTFVTKKMQNPINFFSELRATKTITDNDNDRNNADSNHN